MTKLLFILLLLSMGFNQNLIENITESYKDGMPKEISYYQRVGKKIVLTKLVEYHKNGQIYKEENYKNGKMNGKSVRYFENGQISEDAYFKDGKVEGKANIYYENGQISEERNFRDGKKDGKWTTYYKNGHIETEQNYKNGNRDGKWTSYYEKGQIKEEGNLKDGNRNVKWIEYYLNGKIKSKGNLKNELREGEWLYYYNDGIVKTQGYLKNGKKEGKWIHYYKDGEIDSIDFYKEDSIDYIYYEEPPQPIISPKPIYPEFAGKFQIEGKVYVKFLIDKKGNVDPNKISIVKGVPGLDQAAINAVKLSKWVPAKRENIDVAVYYTIPIRFKLIKK